MKNSELYLKLFTSTFSLSAFTFGGGYVIVPLMRKKFVEQLKWIEEEEMIDMIAISQSAPGPLAINAAIMIGYRLAGMKGALLATLGTMLPPLILITLISVFYETFIQIEIIATLLYGMRAAIAAIILDVVIKLTKEIINKQGLFYVMMLIIAFIASSLFDLHLFVIIVGCGLISFLYEQKKGAIK